MVVAGFSAACFIWSFRTRPVEWCQKFDLSRQPWVLRGDEAPDDPPTLDGVYDSLEEAERALAAKGVFASTCEL